MSWEGGEITARAELNGDGALPWLGPGLVDLQVNGCAGHDLNAPRIGAEVVAGVTRHLWKHGVTGYLATLVTGADERIAHAARVIGRFATGGSAESASVLGIHLEGPFISTVPGALGAHDSRYVRAPDWESVQRWQDASEGTVRVVTLAPELPGACGFIERCVTAGIVVAIGHTAASPEQIRDAIAAGATLSTHLGNGMEPIVPRHANCLWEQLGADQLWASLIADGQHLPPAVLRVMLRAKAGRALLISDAVSVSSLEPGVYELPVGGKVRLTEDGKLVLAGDERLLAGSVRLLPFGIAHLVRSGLASLADAWSMASERPARLLGMDPGLRPGGAADLVLFDWDGTAIRPRSVYVRGHEVFAADQG